MDDKFFAVDFDAPAVRAFVSKGALADLISDTEIPVYSATDLEKSAGKTSEMIALFNAYSKDKQVSKFENRKVAATRVFCLLSSLELPVIEEPEEIDPMIAIREEAERKQAEQAARIAEASAATAAAAERARIAMAEKAASADEVPAATPLADDAGEGTQPPAKRPRGRPRKNPLPAAADGQQAPKAKQAKQAKQAKAPKEKQAKPEGNGTGHRGRKPAMAGHRLYPSKESAAENPRRENSFGWHSMEIVRAKPGITYEAYIEAGGRAKDLAWDISYGFARAEKGTLA